MKKLIFSTVVLAATLAAGTVQAGNGCTCATPVQAAAPVAAPATTARAENGYRAYSYQPAPVAPAIRYAAPVRRNVTGSGFHEAGWKVRGL